MAEVIDKVEINFYPYHTSQITENIDAEIHTMTKKNHNNYKIYSENKTFMND